MPKSKKKETTVAADPKPLPKSKGAAPVSKVATKTAAKAATPAPKAEPKKTLKAEAKKNAAKAEVKTPSPIKPAKPTASKKPSAPKAKQVVITTEEISLRAYYIAERRVAMGFPGDSETDWIEAEAQLRIEKSGL